MSTLGAGGLQPREPCGLSVLLWRRQLSMTILTSASEWKISHQAVRREVVAALDEAEPALVYWAASRFNAQACISGPANNAGIEPPQPLSPVDPSADRQLPVFGHEPDRLDHRAKFLRCRRTQLVLIQRLGQVLYLAPMDLGKAGMEHRRLASSRPPVEIIFGKMGP